MCPCKLWIAPVDHYENNVTTYCKNELLWLNLHYQQSLVSILNQDVNKGHEEEGKSLAGLQFRRVPGQLRYSIFSLDIPTGASIFRSRSMRDKEREVQLLVYGTTKSTQQTLLQQTQTA